MTATPLHDLVRELWPLHRTLVSDGTDEALRIIGRELPKSSSYAVETYTPGTTAWTWRVPERYQVDAAYLEIAGGPRVVDFADNPLHLVSYSVPVDALLDWKELEPHLNHAARRPDAIPWEFKFYERGWGFCLSKTQFDRLPRDARYRAVIRSRFLTEPDQGLRLGVAKIDPEGGPTESGELLVCAHVDHPMQANDDISGVVTAVEVARRLAARPLPPRSMSVRFLFVPEVVGTVCYLSRHAELIPSLRGGIFCEMTGNRNRLALQRSLQHDHLIDRVAHDVLERRAPGFADLAFRSTIAANDEIVINGPGVNVPCLSINRWPYDEYHTSDDDPHIVFEDMLREAADVIEEIVRTYASDYVPRRTFRGPVFLSGHGLWVDWRENPRLNAAVEAMMLRFEGDQSVYEIAKALDLDHAEVRAYIERFREAGLVEALPLPGTPGRS